MQFETLNGGPEHSKAPNAGDPDPGALEGSRPPFGVSRVRSCFREFVFGLEHSGVSGIAPSIRVVRALTVKPVT